MENTNNTETHFGIEWKTKKFRVNNNVDVKYTLDPYQYCYENRLENPKFGMVFVTDNALDRINEHEHYKILSLIFEYNCFNPNPPHLTLIVREEYRHKSKWGDTWHKVFYIDDFLNTFPTSLSEKKQRALYLLYLQHKDYGDEIKNITDDMLFAKNKQERDFILQAMVEQDLLRDTVNVRDTSVKDIADMRKERFCIADNGWKELDVILRANARKQVFIAMKFKNRDNIKDVIKTAISAAGLNPNRIDEKEHINNISSEIQHDIQQSGLVIADLTAQNQGVYFEAGYAMGLRIPVILCCPQNEQKNIHFDICQYNTILYKNEQDLAIRLKDRICAVMGLNKANSGGSPAL
jgi:nucleoside 2-deoxyribosyltransferase